MIQLDGTLKMTTGRVYKHRAPIKAVKDAAKQWRNYYWRFRESGKTFRQAYAYFEYCNHYRLPTDLPLMPRDSVAWYYKIEDVRKEDLIPEPDAQPAEKQGELW